MTDDDQVRPLAGQVAVVAGATRGGGRGIAVALGEAGATVYCTGRSTLEQGAPPGRPETIEGTAERVTEAGGEGIAVQVDHTREQEVEALAERLREEVGGVDVLVNSIWGGDVLTEWGTPFWELNLDKGRTMLERAIVTHLVTNRHLVPLILDKQGGLVVEVTDGDGFLYRGNLFYDLVKTSVIRLAFAMEEELAGKGVTALAVTPGFMRSEAVLDHFDVTEETWQEATGQDPHFAHSETPLFLGRAVAALAADPNVDAKGGRVFASWTLAEEYGFRDIDGRQPDWGAHFQEVGTYEPLDESFYAYWTGSPSLTST